MAVELATAYISLVPSMKGAQGAIAGALAPAVKDADKTGKQAGKRFGAGFGKGTAALGGTMVGLLAGAKVVSFFKDANAEAREAEKVGKLTAQVIKSTGGAANVTSKQVGDLAGALSRKTGIDDEAIQSGANLLLTFKNIRNEAGKGSKIFDRATAAAADLSAAGFGDLSSTSKQLGKALNDPVRGITALTRSGVTFTDQQKEQITTLVESGKTLDAQKIILKEVESQVGGAAAASSTFGEKASVAFGNLKEQVGTALLPAFDQIARFLTERVIPAVSAFVEFLRKNPAVIYAVAAGLGALALAFIAVQIAAFAIPLAIAAVVAGLVYAYKESETFRTIVNAVFKAVGAAAKFMWNSIIKPAFASLKQAVGDLKTAFVKTRDGITGAWKTVQTKTQQATLWVADKVLWMAEKILGAMVAAFGWAPGIGDDLKKAQTKVKEFRAGVNKELDAITDENIKVKVSAGVSTAPGGFTLRDGVRLFKAGGGPIVGPGGPRSDSIPAMLSNGEWVSNARVVKRAGGFGVMAAIEAMILRGEFAKKGDVPRYAKGGPVVTSSTPAMGGIYSRIGEYRDQQALSLAQETGKALFKFIQGMLAGLGAAGKLTPAQVARGQSFAKAQAGKPYVWGGVGPGGYDCSGAVSAVLNAAKGRNPYQRLGATGSMPWAGSSAGKGIFTYGWFTGNPGHTAANVGGLNFESRGGEGFVTGSRARSPLDPMFSRVAHFGRGTDFVPRDGMAFLHKGEAVTPSELSAESIGAAVADALAGVLRPLGVGGDVVIARMAESGNIKRSRRR